MTTPTLRRRRGLLGLALSCLLGLSGCFSTTHTVGRGPTNGERIEETQWYGLFGLVPVGGSVDGGILAGDVDDYSITTEFKLLDIVISAVTSWASFYRQTVEVER